LNLYYNEGADCDDPISYTFSCTQSSLCEQLNNNDDADGADTPSTLCYRVRSCFIGFCSTSDWVETEEIDTVCSLADETDDDGEGLCVEGWDSSWWMTDYVEAVDCDDTSAIYLECSESVGDVSSSTAASLGFSAVGAAVLVSLWFSRRRRRRQLEAGAANSSSKADNVMVATEMATVSASSFERMA